MDELIIFLEEMIKATEEAKLPLNMEIWHCGTSCCLIGDLAIAKAPNDKDLNGLCVHLSNELDDLFEDILGERGEDVAESIYGSTYMVRRTMAYESDFFTFEEMQHPHLNEEHSDRKIAIDFIRLVVGKLENL